MLLHLVAVDLVLVDAAAARRFAECLQRSEGDIRLYLRAVVRPAERFPVLTALPLDLLMAGPGECLALQPALQLFPPESPQ